MPADATVAAGKSRFPTTRWTLIIAARESPQARRAALEELLALYWKPLYLFVRRKGVDRDDAKDVVQGFMAHLLERDFLSKLDPAKGRCRAYLHTALSRYLINVHAHDTAQKRGGAVQAVALDFEIAERQLDDSPAAADAAFDREWAVGVMERALQRLEAEFDQGRRRGPFAVVRRFFEPGDEVPSYATVAADHGMSIPQLKAFLHRARTRFRELVRDEVLNTVADASEVETEVGELLRALRAS